MCGILGALNFNSQLSIDRFQDGLSLIERRGPDFQSFKELNNRHVLLGHTRLSIIDTSAAANQPLSDLEQNYWITFNGEIYNHVELKKELTLKGYSFRTRSDTEIIILSYIEWGENCVSRFRGIFAFAIYSVLSRSLFIARDPNGIKPLYYLYSGNHFAFSSTPTSLLAALDQPRLINNNALYAYLWFGNVPGSLSIYQNVQKLLPGHRLTLDCTTWNVDNSKYSFIPLLANRIDCFSEKNIEVLVKDALYMNQRSDVPVSYLLSGGLDSTILCSLAQEVSANPIRSFSVGFDDARSDETAYAKYSSSIIGTNHSVALLSYHDAVDQLWNIAISFDEPFHLNSLIPFSFLSEFVTSNGYKVAIGGDGADELFGGYLWHSEWWQQRSRSIFGNFRSIRNKFGMRSQTSLDDYLKIFLTHSGGVSSSLLSEILKCKPSDYVSDQLAFDKCGVIDSVMYPLLVDQSCFLPDHCLTKVDRCSMNFGLEVRVPFLDQELHSYISQLSSKELIDDFTRKSLLKSAFKRQLSNIDLNRKKGFSSPLHHWWNEGFASIADYAFAQSGLIASSPLLVSLLEISRNQNNVNALYILFSLVLWSDCWLEDGLLSDTRMLRSL